ncbi:MAG: FliH/SctL family protein [Caloramator sp.]|nr:FliH/SctL family protein [Caloramator sp.]
MQSYSKVIKYSEIKGDAVIAPPVIEKLLEMDTEGESSQTNTIETLKMAILEDAKERARSLIEVAEREAKDIINKANESANSMLEDAQKKGYSTGYTKGYQDGFQKGLDEAKIEAQKLKEEIDLYAKNVQLEVKEYIKQKEEEIIRLSLEIARQILKSEITVNKEAILNIARSVISKSLDKRQIILKLNPSDYSFLKGRRDELEIFVENSNDLILLADPDVQEGDVVAETPSGYIDAKIETQIKQILNKLLRND